MVVYKLGLFGKELNTLVLGMHLLQASTIMPLPFIGCLVNSLPNDKVLDWSKLKALADDKKKCD